MYTIALERGGAPYASLARTVFFFFFLVLALGFVFTRCGLGLAGRVSGRFGGRRVCGCDRGERNAAATEGKENVRCIEGGKNNLGLMTLKAAFRHMGSATAAAAAAQVSDPAPLDQVNVGRFSWHRSKLTAALRPFFADDAGQVMLLITASPDVDDAAQTSQTLEEGVTVAGRAMAAKTIVDVGVPQAPARFLRVAGGRSAAAAAVDAAAAGRKY